MPFSGSERRLTQQQATNDQRAESRDQAGAFREAVAIEPANADTIDVPYYDPAVVYGEWPYPEYPPYTGIRNQGMLPAALSRWASPLAGPMP